MKRIRVGGIAREDLDNKLFQVVQETARHFVNDIERLGRRYPSLHGHLHGAADDLGRLRWRVESSLMSLVGGHMPATRRKRNHRFSSKRVSVSDWRDWPELAGDELGLKTVRTMPHDGGDFEVLLPDDPNPAEVTRRLSFWRRIIQHAIHH